MAGIALFVPNDQMYQQAQEILGQMENHHVVLLKTITTENAVNEAREAVSQEANIIVARGRQAVEIQRHTTVPVSEIVMSAQELGLLVAKAKSLVEKERPCIGLFGWGNMFSDTTYFDQLYGVRLIRCALQGSEDWRAVMDRVLEENAVDIVIGGKAALSAAQGRGIPALFLSSTGESIRTALHNAESLYNVSKMEQHNYAQFSTVLDSSFSGIIKAGPSGKILVMNRAMEQITGISAQKAMGQPVEKVLAGLDESVMRRILSGEEETYSAFLNINDQSLVVVLEPIVAANQIDGVIVSCNRMRRLESDAREVNRNQILKGYVAYGTFDDIDRNLKGLRQAVERARIYAQSSSPMLIEAISGPELDIICQGIHNYSLRKNGPFIMMNMAGLKEDQQMKVLFGEYSRERHAWEPGLIEEANHGTLVIQSIDKLTLPVQYNLMKVIRTKRLLTDRMEDMQLMDTRIIACTAKNLTELRKVDKIRSDLYFTLKSLRLKIPNLKDRPEDVGYLLDKYVKKYSEQYCRYHVMTAGARKVLLEYPWAGNSIQLDAFCERMILTVGKRTITESYVRELLEELYETDSGIYEILPEDEAREERLRRQEARQQEAKAERRPGKEEAWMTSIQEALEKYHGNRTLAAKELGISTTTLWRWMKRYQMNEN